MCQKGKQLIYKSVQKVDQFKVAKMGNISCCPAKSIKKIAKELQMFINGKP